MKKSSKTAIIVIVLIAVTLGLLALGGLFTNRVASVDTSKFFELAGIEYKDATAEDGSETKTIVYNADKAVIKKIVVNVYNLTGYNATNNGKAVYSASLYPQTIFTEEFEILKKNGVVIDCADPNAGSFWSSLVMPALMLGVGLLAVMFLMRSVNGANRARWTSERPKLA